MQSQSWRGRDTGILVFTGHAEHTLAISELVRDAVSKGGAGRKGREGEERKGSKLDNV